MANSPAKVLGNKQKNIEKGNNIKWDDLVSIVYWYPGPRLNIKTVLSTYDDFHVKDKTAVRTSYL